MLWKLAGRWVRGWQQWKLLENFFEQFSLKIWFEFFWKSSQVELFKRFHVKSFSKSRKSLNELNKLQLGLRVNFLPYLFQVRKFLDANFLEKPPFYTPYLSSFLLYSTIIFTVADVKVRLFQIETLCTLQTKKKLNFRPICDHCNL